MYASVYAGHANKLRKSIKKIKILTKWPCVGYPYVHLGLGRCPCRAVSGSASPHQRRLHLEIRAVFPAWSQHRRHRSFRIGQRGRSTFGCWELRAFANLSLLAIEGCIKPSAALSEDWQAKKIPPLPTLSKGGTTFKKGLGQQLTA